MSRSRRVLTLDLGTSATKAALWEGSELVALTRSAVPTVHPAAGRAEQDPRDWWSSVDDACAQLRASEPEQLAAVDVIGFSAARETFALFDEQLEPLGPGILWSDQRAGPEAESLGDAAAFRAATGVVLNGAACAAKVAWVAAHDADSFARARWILAPRDYVFARLTGEVLTDETLASRTGLYALDGTVRTSDQIAGRLPRVGVPTASAPCRAPLGIDSTAEVVVGAGDRACEVLGLGAGADRPMVSWGTTANVSIPHPGPEHELPTVAAVSRDATGGFLVEAGLSAGGAAVAWLARVTGLPHDALLDAAADVEPGAGGVVALPWFHGARGPWWESDAHAAFVGLTAAHGPAELARAIVEAVALDVARCLELLDVGATELMIGGGGARHPMWRTGLAAATGRALVRRRHDDAASVGARLVVARAGREDVDLEQLNPVLVREECDPALVERYRHLRAKSDDAAHAVLGLTTT